MSAFQSFLREGTIQELIFRGGGHILFRKKGEEQQHLATLMPGGEGYILERLFRDAVPAVPSWKYEPYRVTLGQVVPWIILMVFGFAWFAALRQLISKDERFTPSRPRRPTEQTKFADVISKSKIELQEIVDYLNRPEKYVLAGAKLPRGALLVGPSGTGKTLLARAVAGEARCPFISASASEFVEVYVGRGAARVRDLFRIARDQAPSVLFLDELDALGSRSSTSNGHVANEEYVQTLNQLLTELDGFHGKNDNVVILAATNRREAIDPSLLRPGRFDRHVFVELPDEDERLEILRLHSEKAPLSSEMKVSDLRRVAVDTAGASGAELANIVNEAIFLALREGRKRTIMEDFKGAAERSRVARRGRAETDRSASSANRSSGWTRHLPPGMGITFMS